MNRSNTKPSFEGVIWYWGGRESIFVFCATLVFNKHFFMSHTWKLGVHRKSMSIMTLPDSIHEWLFHHGNSDCSITPFRDFITFAYFCDHSPWVKPCFHFGIQPWSPWHTARGTLARHGSSQLGRRVVHVAKVGVEGLRDVARDRLSHSVVHPT